MADALIAILVVALLADVIWAEARTIRAQHHSDRLTVRLAAARRGVRTATPPASGALALTQITAPCNRDLYRWIAATDGAPTIVQGRARFTGEADTITPVRALPLSRRLAAA